MKGQYLEFIKIENDNEMYRDILKEIASSTSLFRKFRKLYK